MNKKKLNKHEKISNDANQKAIKAQKQAKAEQLFVLVELVLVLL
jgi:hypothetical protein